MLDLGLAPNRPRRIHPSAPRHSLNRVSPLPCPCAASASASHARAAPPTDLPDSLQETRSCAIAIPSPSRRRQRITAATPPLIIPVPSPCRVATTADAAPSHPELPRTRVPSPSPRRLVAVSSREAAEPRLSLSLASSRHRRSRQPSLALPPQIPAVAAVGRASPMFRRRSRSLHVPSCRFAVESPPVHDAMSSHR